MRKFISIFLGAMLAMVCSFMTPALASEPTPQLSAVHTAKAAMAVATTETAITVTQHATASASESRTSSFVSSALTVTPATACSVSVIALEVDHSPGSSIAIAGPGDEEGDEDGMDLAA